MRSDFRTTADVQLLIVGITCSDSRTTTKTQLISCDTPSVTVVATMLQQYLTMQLQGLNEIEVSLV
jgi:hypothetical protein